MDMAQPASSATNQSFKISSTSLITRYTIPLRRSGLSRNINSCITSALNRVNSSSGCISSVVNSGDLSSSYADKNFNITDIQLTGGTTYYLKLFQPSGDNISIKTSNNNAYLNGCYYYTSASCYSSGQYDIDFIIYGDVIPAQVCGNSIIEPPEYCDDGTAKNGLFYYRCNSTCNGYVINFMGIELINYMATSTAINASSTVIAGVYNSAFILYVFIFSVMAMLLFLVKLFFYSDK